ncbi:hypothetical protein [Streptomyces sp. NPDC059452]|uniref:hypothetical protein n=1 Tax=Streptomyces sp. NPDC059452 TaxID=3346835 RepID=UPI0036B8C36B
MTTIIAPLPNSSRRDDPLWLRMFHNYGHVITPLRYAGWVTDIETAGGGEFYIHADLRDGTEVAIASEYSLPVDPAEVTGWSAIRRDVEGTGTHTVLYDSTPNGPQRHHGNSLFPLLARIDGIDVPSRAPQLMVSATRTSPFGASRNQTAGIEGPASAIARFAEWSRRLTDREGYRRVWLRPEREGYPMAMFEGAGHTASVRVTRSND